MLPSSAPGGREFHFTEQDFEKVRKLIYDYAGIALSPTKHDMVYGRLARRLRALGLSTFQQYLQILERGNSKEFELFTNSLTTNLTSFFREAHHFDMFRQHLTENKSQGSFSIWCSASSTGEEPYSIAMTVCEAFNTLTPPVTIIATDIDTNVLATAANGVYNLDRLEKMPADRARRFFLRGKGDREGQVRVRPELRQMITFKPLNLLDKSWALQGPFDIMFCRNVMIYFDKSTQYKILKRFAPLMSENGLLFAGHSESFLHAADIFRSQGKTVYQLTPGARVNG